MSQPPVRILIDGYNLLFQSNLVGRGRGPGWLEKARLRLQTHLENGLTGLELQGTQVVYDANGSRSLSEQGSSATTRLTSGLLITFAQEHPEADDLLEELIRKHSHAKQLTVVSSDLRIKKCAQTRRARTMGAEQFLDRLENRLAEKESSGFSVEDRFGTHGDEHQMGEQEISFWMDEFGIE